MNVALDPYELGKQLVLAAQSVGTSTSDPFWILAWGNLFGAAVYLLSELDPNANAVTLNSLLEAVMRVQEVEDMDEQGNLRRVRRRLIELLPTTIPIYLLVKMSLILSTS